MKIVLYAYPLFRQLLTCIYVLAFIINKSRIKFYFYYKRLGERLEEKTLVFLFVLKHFCFHMMQYLCHDTKVFTFVFFKEGKKFLCEVSNYFWKIHFLSSNDKKTWITVFRIFKRFWKFCLWNREESDV